GPVKPSPRKPGSPACPTALPHRASTTRAFPCRARPNACAPRSMLIVLRNGRLTCGAAAPPPGPGISAPRRVVSEDGVVREAVAIGRELVRHADEVAPVGRVGTALQSESAIGAGEAGSDEDGARAVAPRSG